MSKCTAVVKWFNNNKGFGFLQNIDGEDVFVHHNNLLMDGYRQLFEGQNVEYTEVKSEKGLAAVEVEPIDLPNPTIELPTDPVGAATVLREKFSEYELDLLIDALVGEPLPS